MLSRVKRKSVIKSSLKQWTTCRSANFPCSPPLSVSEMFLVSSLHLRDVLQHLNWTVWFPKNSIFCIASFKPHDKEGDFPVSPTLIVTSDVSHLLDTRSRIFIYHWSNLLKFSTDEGFWSLTRVKLWLLLSVQTFLF